MTRAWWAKPSLLFFLASEAHHRVTAACKLWDIFRRLKMPTVRKKELEKAAIVMHCNLRPPNVAPMVSDFNYEDSNVPA